MTRCLWLMPCIGLLVGCSNDHDRLSATVAAHDSVLQEMPRDFYKPGLGDLMHALQLRHAKLWFAGTAENWALAEFEVHEIHENFDRVSRWHADSDDVPMAPSIKAYMQPGRYALEQSIAAQDVKAFVSAFDRFTQGCNDCHTAAQHDFIVIQRPQTEPHGNQRWLPAAKK